METYLMINYGYACNTKENDKIKKHFDVFDFFSQTSPKMMQTYT